MKRVEITIGIENVGRLHPQVYVVFPEAKSLQNKWVFQLCAMKNEVMRLCNLTSDTVCMSTNQ